MKNKELAEAIAYVIDVVQECQGVRQRHEIEAIVREILKDKQPQNE